MRNTTKIGLILLTVLITTALFTTPSHATAAWYTCNVVYAGTITGGTSGYIQLYLTDTATTPAFTKKTFNAVSGMENRMLALALTAMAGGYKLMIYADPSGATSSQRIIQQAFMAID